MIRQWWQQEHARQSSHKRGPPQSVRLAQTLGLCKKHCSGSRTGIASQSIFFRFILAFWFGVVGKLGGFK